MSSRLVLLGALAASPVVALAHGDHQHEHQGADSLAAAFKNGVVEGHVGLYGQYQKNKEAADPDRFGFAAGSASLLYETASLHGFSLGFGAWGTTRLAERNSDDRNPPNGDYKDEIMANAIIHNAFLRYQHDDFGHLTAGLQEIDLEWLTDYIQGVTAEVEAVENLELTLGWAKRNAVVDFDGVSERFELMNDSRGLYFLDAKYTPWEWLELNPYYYHAAKMFRAPGLKATATLELSEGLESATGAQFVRSSTDADSGLENGDLLWLSQDFSYRDATLGGGWLKVDRRGTGGIDSFGDQQPFEEGNNIFTEDARTWYLNAGYSLADLGLDLGLLYGRTRYLDTTSGDYLREKELNLTADYEIIENLSLGVIFAKVSHDDPAESYQVIKTTLQYNF